MLTEVPLDRLAAFAPYFADVHAALVVDSIVAGNTPGRLWIGPGDSALLWDQGNNVFYLAAPDRDPTIQRELAALLAEGIRPAALAGGRASFKARALTPAAAPALQAIFRPLRELATRLYALDGPPAAVADRRSKRSASA